MVIERKRGCKVEYVLYIEDKSGRVREIGQYCKSIKELIAIRDMYNNNPLFETAYIMKRTTRHEFVPEDDLLKYVDEQKLVAYKNTEVINMLHDIVVIIIFIGLLALYGLALYTLVSSVIELIRKDRKDDDK